MSAPEELNRAELFDVRLQSIVTDTPLPYDLYLVVNFNAILFKSNGDILSKERRDKLIEYGGRTFLIPNAQRQRYLKTIQALITSPDVDTITKSTFIKEAAFIHVGDLFTRKDIGPVVGEVRSLVNEMVDYICTDSKAIYSLVGLSAHDYRTYNHSVNASVYAVALTRKLFGDKKELLLAAGFGAFLHDIGKRRLPKTVIDKLTPLTDEDWQTICQHPHLGKQELDSIEGISDEIKDLVLHHHENYDGSGYPQGLKGDQISELARIITIADCFDALTTTTGYSRGHTSKRALESMIEMEGKFDPSIFKPFRQSLTKITSDWEIKVPPLTNA